MSWIKVEDEMPTLFMLVVLMIKDHFMAMPFDTVEPYPVCKIGYYNDSWGGYWSCHGERALDLKAASHWCALPSIVDGKIIPCFLWSKAFDPRKY